MPANSPISIVTVPSQNTLFSVAEILIYDRELTPEENWQVLEYLENRFFTEPVPIPEPTSFCLLGLGILAGIRHQRRRMLACS